MQNQKIFSGVPNVPSLPHQGKSGRKSGPCPEIPCHSKLGPGQLPACFVCAAGGNPLLSCGTQRSRGCWPPKATWPYTESAGVNGPGTGHEHARKKQSPQHREAQAGSHARSPPAPRAARGSPAPSRDHKESFPWPHTWETVVWQDLLRWRRTWASAVPPPSIPPWEESDRAFSEAQTETVSGACVTSELGVSEPTWPAAGPGGLPDPVGCVPGGRGRVFFVKRGLYYLELGKKQKLFQNNQPTSHPNDRLPR